MARNYYDEIVSFFDEDIDVYDDDFNVAAAEIIGPVAGRFDCSCCEKTYKTKGGLNRHINQKHTDPVDDALDSATLLTLISKSLEVLSEDLCFSLERRCSLSSYIYCEERLPVLLNEINNLYGELVVNNNLESFDAAYFSIIVFNAPVYFDNLPHRSSTLLATKLGETIINHFQNQKAVKNSIVPTQKASALTGQEIDALQYLSGYVVKKLLKKTKQQANYHSPENQEVIAILQHAIKKDIRDQTLISLQSRGGLTAVTDDCQRIFRRAEEQFRIETSVASLRKIDIKKITHCLLEDDNVVSLFNAMVDMEGSVSLVEEIKQNLLQNMLMLYLRVRSFSLAKDITSKKKSSESSTKALRKGIKKSIEQ